MSPIWRRRPLDLSSPSGHHAELNAPFYPWGAGVNGNTPSDAVRAWDRVRQVFTAHGANNVTWAQIRSACRVRGRLRWRWGSVKYSSRRGGCSEG